MGEIIARFLLGGSLVAAFAALGEIFEPKSFAGMFGAAPSVALATLAMTFANDGAAVATVECAAMVVGAVGFLAYSAACVRVLAAPALPAWLGAALCWLVWLCVAFGLKWLLSAAGVA